MNGKSISLLSFVIGGALFGAPSDPLALQEMSIALEQLNHKLHSHTVDIQLFQERISAMEKGLDKLQQETPLLDKSLEKRVSALEKGSERLINDFKTLKSHLNETVLTLSQCQGQLGKIEKQLSSDILSLKTSLSTILGLLQGSTPSPRTYIVQNGDSLSEIAQLHKTDTATLKRLNNLSSDTIYPEQKLILP
jgi:LysM repeat protein